MGATEVSSFTTPGNRTSARNVTALVVGDAPVVVTTTWRGGYAIEPPTTDLAIGQRSGGLRVLDVVAEGRAVRVDVEGVAGTTADLGVHGAEPAAVSGAGQVTWRGNRGTVRVAFPASASGSTRRVSLTIQPR